MRFGWRLAALFLILVLAISTCSRAPADAPDPGAGSTDPEVGGGAGADTGPQTPVPTPTPTREGSPRLDGTATMALPPTATADRRLPTAEPPTAETMDDGPQTTATPTAEATGATTDEGPPTIDPAAPTVPPPTAEPPTPPATHDSPSATPTPTPGGERIHIVQPGENLYRIGLLYGLSWVAIAEYNGITDPNTITAGQELRIPPSPTATPVSEARGSGGAGEQGSGGGEEATVDRPVIAPEPPPTVGQDDGPPIVAVVAGDTLYGISRQYGVDWAQVAEANGLATPNQLYPGQLLKIPPDVPGPTPEFNHRVHNGETLSGLARQYGLPADELAAANGLAAPFTIYSGQTLVIPSDK
jgi:LysM repeat protein